MRNNNALDPRTVICPVYEDNHLLIVIKPPNMLTQGDETGDTSLYDAVKEYIRISANKPGEAYVGMVHRLDRPVGGLVAFAKTSKAAARLSEQVRSHHMAREYLAVCEQENTLPESGTLSDYLYQDQEGFIRCASGPRNDAKKAVLHYTTLCRKDGNALVYIRLETGRKHQIRAQFSSFGHPLLYDMRYGHGIRGKSIALWGAVLKLTHPTLKSEMYFTSYPDTEPFVPYYTAINAFFQSMNNH